MLNVSTTLSAPSFVSKIISAITFGRSVINRQDITTPPTGVIALSISAKEVPCDRFFTITIYGPARPRIDIADAGFDAPTMLNWLLRAGEDAEACRVRKACSLRFPRAPPLGPRGGSFLLEFPFRDAGLFRECRSCVQSALTLPAAGLLLIIALGLVVVEMDRYGMSDAEEVL